MGFFKPTWMTIAPDDYHSNKYHRICRSLQKLPCKKLAEIAINSPNEDVCREAVNEFASRGITDHMGEYTEIIRNAAFPITRAGAAVGYFKNTKDRCYVNEVFESVSDGKARAYLSEYLEDTKYLNDLKNLDRTVLSRDDIETLIRGIHYLERKEETEQREENIRNIDNMIGDTEKLQSILKQYHYNDDYETIKEYHNRIFERIRKLDVNALPEVILASEDVNVITDGIKYIEQIRSEEAINKLIEGRDRLDAYHRKTTEKMMLEAKKKIISEKTCPNGSHDYELLEAYNDIYDNEIRIYNSVYRCRKCGLIKEESDRENGMFRTYYRWE